MKSEHIEGNSIEKQIKESGHKSILVVCAHSDDQILGPGGTLAKLSSEGAKIVTVIMSYGELTPAWIKHKYTIETRINEAEKADKIVGGNGVIFLGLKEGNFIKEVTEKEVYPRLRKIIKREQPTLLFTHTREDPHKDHTDTLRIVKDLVAELDANERPGVYSFGIWNPFQLHRRAPHLVVDISRTFKKKLKALKCFQSQRLVILLLTPGVIIRAKLNGFLRGISYAEVFRRVNIDE